MQEDAVEFYLDTNSTLEYQELIKHLRTWFESVKTFSLLFSDVYSRVQLPWEAEEQFFNELQILSQKVISVRPA